MELLRSLGGFRNASSLYKPLKAARHEIRILTLLPDPEESSTIRCNLEHVSLFDLPLYDALSYCWGDPKVTETLTLGGFRVEATTNLVAALRQLRRRSLKEQKLWVDALCINQDDEDERATQVNRMRDIYSNAAEVLVWLGPADKDSKSAIDLMRALSERPPDPYGPSLWEAAVQARNDPYGRWAEQWKSCDVFFARPYWRRVWVIQEIAVASKVSLYCGEQVIPWAYIQPMLPHMDLVDFEKFRRGIKSEKLGTLLQALFDSRMCLATDPRDKIYALLGLANDGNIIRYVNYVQPIEVVLQLMTKAILLKYGCGDVITLKAPDRSNHPGVPSWVPDWTELHKSCRPWQAHCLQKTKSRAPEDLYSLTQPFEFRGNELGMTGLVLGTIDGLTTSLCQPAWDRRLVQPRISPWLEQSVLQRNLMDALLFDGGPPGPYAEFDLSEFWSLRARIIWRERYPDLIQWLDENESFSVGGQVLRPSALPADHYPPNSGRHSPPQQDYYGERLDTPHDHYMSSQGYYPGQNHAPNSGRYFPHQQGNYGERPDIPHDHYMSSQGYYPDPYYASSDERPDTPHDHYMSSQGYYPDPYYASSDERTSQQSYTPTQQPNGAPPLHNCKSTRLSFWDRFKREKKRDEESTTSKHHDTTSKTSMEQLSNTMSQIENVLKHGMRFFVTEGQYFGMVHSQAQRNDIVVFLRGCSMPLVLRKSEENILLQKWKVIGEAYVHGFSTSDIEEEKMERFWIV